MDYARRQRNPSRHIVGISIVILIHALVIWAMVTGLARQAIQVIKKPITATIIEEVKPPPPPPPPPPPKKIVEQPKIEVPVQPYVPPPDVPPPVVQEAPVITAVQAEPPPKQEYVIAPPPPPVVAPPAPAPAPVAKPAVRRGIVRIAGDDPTYPRDAIRAGVSKGRVLVRLQIDEKGNVTDVNIVSAEPPRVFDRVVRNALSDWKFKAEGEKYVGEVEINFTLRD